MVEDTIPEKSLFMICRKLNPAAVSHRLPEGYTFRSCRPDELDLWMAMPFADPAEANEYRGFMQSFFDRVYAAKRELFFATCTFVCDEEDRPVATAFIWTILGDLTTLHWLKVKPEQEGRGIGRAILTRILEPLAAADYPVLLHTHPTSFRAVKLYSDMGFALLSDPIVGTRTNDLEECLPILERVMPRSAFAALEITQAPQEVIERLRREVEPEF